MMSYSIKIPDIKFPAGIDDALEEYIKSGSNLSTSYISECGIDESDLIPEGFLPGLIRLYASIQYFRENPENGLAAINVAIAFDRIGEIDKAIEVLVSLNNAGLPGINNDALYEDPFFLIGFWLADYNRITESLIYYSKCLDRQIRSNHGILYTHLGTVYHSIKVFKKALECYHTAYNLFQEFGNDHTHEQQDMLNDLMNLAKQKKPFSFKRSNYGIQSPS